MATLIQFVGYAADQPLSAEDTAESATLLWESPSGGAGLVHFTGSYWAIFSWTNPTVEERSAVRRMASRVSPATLPYLGADGHYAGFDRWHGRRDATTASQDQMRLLAKLGPRPAAGLPAFVASMAISLLRAAGDVINGTLALQPQFDPNPARVSAAFSEIQQLESGVPLLDYWEAIRAIDREVFVRPA